MAYTTATRVRMLLRNFLAKGMLGSLSESAATAMIEDYIERADEEISGRIAGRMTVTDAAACGLGECSALLAAYKLVQDEFSGRGEIIDDSHSADSWRADAERILLGLLSLSAEELAAAEGLDLPDGDVGQMPCVRSTLGPKTSILKTELGGVTWSKYGRSVWD